VGVLGTVRRGVGRVSPSLDTRLLWMRYRRGAAGLRLVDAIVSRGDTVVDVGAADALYAARMSQLVGRRGRILAFEPNPAQFAHVQELAARRDNVTAHPIGLSDQAATAELHIPVLDDALAPGLGSVAVPGTRSDVPHRTVSVTLERLDTVLESQTDTVDFLKIDVEGHEFSTLQGAEETLRRSRPVILIEIEQRHQDAPIQRTFDYLAGLGYRGWSVHHDSLEPLEDFDVQRDQLAYLQDEFSEMVAPGYVNDFLFLAEGADVAPLAAAVQRTR
jgi:FkbM family methyltransferase